MVFLYQKVHFMIEQNSLQMQENNV